MKKITNLFVCLLLTASYAQNSGTIDATFQTGTGVTGGITGGFPGTVKIDTNGKIYLGGNFSKYNNVTVNKIVRLNTNGTIDTSFNQGTGFNSTVRDIYIYPDGKILAAGYFTTYNGTPTNGLIRLNNDGTVDTTFALTRTGFQSTVLNKVRVQPDGKIICAGGFATYNGVSSRCLIRLNSDGTHDTSFNVGLGLNNQALSINLLSDNKILVSGSFSEYQGITVNRIVRLNTDGSIDFTFDSGNGFDNWVYTTVIQPDGKILVGGDFSAYNGIGTNRIARLNTDGSFDTSFNTGGGFDNTVSTIALDPNGRILVGGGFTTYNGLTNNRIIKLYDNGSKDNTFITGIGMSAGSSVQCLARQADSKFLVGGAFMDYNGTNINRIMRLENNYLSTNQFELNEKITLYPNPATDYLNIELPSTITNYTYEIIDILGKKIQSNNGNVNAIKIQNLPNGIYTLHIKSIEGQDLFSKFVKL